MRYFRFLLLLFALTVGTLSLCFFIYKKGYNKFYSNEIKSLDEKLRGKQFHDLLFIGSSRTYYHIHPGIVDSILHTNSFNAGLDGANFFETRLVLKSYLKSHPAPKYIVIDIPTFAFDSKQRPFFNPNIYYPYLGDSFIYNELKPHKPVFLFKYLPFLQLTETDDYLRQNALFGWAGKTMSERESFYKGHQLGGYDSLRLPFKRVDQFQAFNIDSEGIGLFKQIIGYCRERNIKLIAIFPPVYRFAEEKLNPDFFNTVNKICSQHNIPFLNYQAVELGNNHTLFRDEHHLNRQGASIFSKMLANDIGRFLDLTAISHN